MLSFCDCFATTWILCAVPPLRAIELGLPDTSQLGDGSSLRNVILGDEPVVVTDAFVLPQSDMTLRLDFVTSAVLDKAAGKDMDNRLIVKAIDALQKSSCSDYIKTECFRELSAKAPPIHASAPE